MYNSLMSIENPYNNVENYSAEQIARWEHGAENHASFLEDIDDQVELGSKLSGSLQAMFLGEKPAIFSSWPENIEDNLRSAGFELTLNYIYAPEQVSIVMEEHSNEFSQHNLTTPQEVMEFLDKAELKEHSTMRGLVLGFPIKATENYTRREHFKFSNVAQHLYHLLEKEPEDHTYLEQNYLTEKRHGNVGLVQFFREKLETYKSELGINDEEIMSLLNELQIEIDTKNFGAYGVFWTDSPDSEESVSKEKRIKDAFEKSGILI